MELTDARAVRHNGDDSDDDHDDDHADDNPKDYDDEVARA